MSLSFASLGNVRVNVKSPLDRDWQIPPRRRQHLGICTLVSRPHSSLSPLQWGRESGDIPILAMTVAPSSPASAMISPSGLTTSECPYYHIISNCTLLITRQRELNLQLDSSRWGVGRANTWRQTSGYPPLCQISYVHVHVHGLSREWAADRARWRRCQCIGPVVVLNAEG